MHIRRTVIERIAEAVCFDHVFPVFQPIVNLRTMRTVGFEVLARWTDQELGEVSPEEFIPAAQTKSLLSLLTYNLIRASCRAAGTWDGDFYLAFNVPPSLLQDPQAMSLLVDAISDAGFSFERVRMEMTEAELIEDEGGARHAVQALKALGIKVVLDDFGTGFSSLVRLNKFDFDEIKIDGVSSTRQCNMINSCTDRSERYGKDGAARHVSSPEARSMATMEGRPVAQRHCPLL